MKKHFFIILIFSLAFCLAAQMSNPDKIVGIWITPGEDLLVKIDKIGSHYQGRIVWLNPEMAAEKALDVKNPNKHLKKMPLKGVKMIEQLSFDPATTTWEGGTFYNYIEGKLYNCRISLVRENQIRISQFSQKEKDGIAEIWTRQ